MYPRDGWLRWRDGKGRVYVKCFEVNDGKMSKEELEKMESDREGKVDDVEEVEMDEVRGSWGQWDKSNKIMEKPWWLGIILACTYFIRVIF